MSQTFSSRSNPARITRGRGSERGRSRPVARSNPTGRPLGLGCETNSSLRTSQNMSYSSGLGRSNQARQPFVEGSFRGTGEGSRGGSTSRERMNPGPGYTNRNPGRADQGCGEGQQDQNEGMDGRGQYAGGYTMFAPNERRRQQVAQMAQRETQAYESYKRANAGKTYNFVRTLGGGEIDENQVRARQANEVRAQKFNRQMRQEQYRQNTRKAEEDAIQAKRDEARRKAELNAQRVNRSVPAEEIRRNREPFLNQLERQKGGSEPSQSASRAEVSPTAPSRVQASAARNNMSTYSRNSDASFTSPTRQASTGQVNQSPGTSRTAQKPSVKPEHLVNQDPWTSYRSEFKHESSEGEEEPYYAIDRMPYQCPRSEELGLLMSMFPDHNPQALAELLQDTGSLDLTIDCLQN